MRVCSVVSASGSPGTVACQAPLSVEFSRQEDWSRLPFPTLEGLPNPGIKPQISCVSCVARQIVYHYATK